MIITSLATKDTYVTNLHLGLNDGTYSNVGKASTLDLFKVSGESKNIKSRAKLKISALPLNNQTFKIQDYLKNSLNDAFTFVFVENENNNSPGSKLGQNYKIGLGTTPFNINELCTQIFNVLTSISNDNSLNFNVTLFKISDDTIIIEQDWKGDVGDKQNQSNATGIQITNFIRIQHSILLLAFDIEGFKNKYIHKIGNSFQVANSVFNNTNNFKAYIKLFDVGSASTRPKDYSLKLSVLSKDFDEGIGSDIYNFSDKGFANFSKLSTSNSWANNAIISQNDCTVGHYLVFDNTNSFSKGNEDCIFDITSYFNQLLNSSQTDNVFAVCFDFDYLFDEYTYFVKRFGSVQINDKINKPRIEVHIDENKIENVTNQSKKRFVSNEEIFYLYNKTSSLSSFNTSYNYFLKLEYVVNDTNVLDDDADSHIISAANVYDFNGKLKTGIKKFTVANDVIDLFNTNIETALLSSDKITVKLTYYYTYTASGVTNTINLHTENVDFYKPIYSSQIENKMLYTKINSQNSDFEANNEIIRLYVDFIDINKEHKAVNKSIDLVSENLGDVFYSIYDIDTNEEIVSKEEANINATKLIYNGDNYTLRLFASEILKNKRINFKFYYNDETSILQKTTFDKKFNIRF